MAFAVSPFLLLSFSASNLAWSRVYYFPVVGIVLSQAFFAAPPTKRFLKKRLASRNPQQRPGSAQMARTLSQDSLSGVGREPVLGVAQDPERDLDEAMQEFKHDLNKLKPQQLQQQQQQQGTENPQQKKNA